MGNGYGARRRAHDNVVGDERHAADHGRELELVHNTEGVLGEVRAVAEDETTAPRHDDPRAVDLERDWARG